MFRSFIKTVGLTLLFVVIATSQMVLIAETESNSSDKNICLVEAYDDTGSDGSDVLLSSIQVIGNDKGDIDQSSSEQYLADVSLNTLLTIRAPPRLCL
jgi:hypothetical protein